MVEFSQYFLKLLVILASLLLTPSAIDLHCDTDFKHHEFCYIRIENPMPVSDASHINFIVPPSWTASEIERMTINVKSNPIPFPIKLFSNFPNLIRLDIRASLSSISSEHFQQADKLTKLILAGNDLENIPSQVFAGAKHLNEIDLHNNEINKIDDFAFKDLVELRELNLGSNRLTKIRQKTFTGLDSLDRLNLSSNKIDEIEEGALNFSNLKWLDLGSNQLKIFSDTLLAYVPKLHTLKIQHNNIHHLNNVLVPLYKLEVLEIGFNPIKDLDLKKFSQFVNLRALSLKSTGFDLDAVSFSADEISSSKSRVIELDLSGCHIRSGVIFSKLKIFPHLEIVHLGNNTLIKMDLEAIRTGGMRKLYIIWFGENNYFDEQWLRETTGRLSMMLDYEERKIIVEQ